MSNSEKSILDIYTLAYIDIKGRYYGLMIFDMFTL
jgi:hypothetical protein